MLTGLPKVKKKTAKTHKQAQIMYMKVAGGCVYFISAPINETLYRIIVHKA